MTGIGLIDLIASLGLGSLVLLIMAKDLTFLLKQSKEISRFEDSLDAELRFKALIEEAIITQDALPIELPIKIFKRGVIRSTQGRRIQLSTNPENLASKESSALAALELRSSSMLRVFEFKPGGAMACPCFPGATLQGVRAFLGIGLGATYYLDLVSEATRYPSGCYHLKVRKSDNLFIENENTPLALMHLLLPIEREYLLYRSVGGVFRYFGFSGTRRLENQPLFNFANHFKLHFIETEDFAHSIELNFNSQSNKITFRPRLKNISNPTFLLNSCTNANS